MPIAPEKIVDLRLKHLEMLQAVVTRMASYSATLKNYCLTLVTAILGFSINVQKPLGVVLAFMVVIVFALLDAQYLRLERRFRNLYDISRNEGFDVQPSFEIDLRKAAPVKFASVFLSWSIGVFYMPMMVGTASVFLIAWWIHGRII